MAFNEIECLGSRLESVHNYHKVFTLNKNKLAKILKNICNISFDKIALFNADYCEYVVL